MTWTGQTFSVGQVLTAAQMGNLQADISAAFAKDAGAPVLANNYVLTAQLNQTGGSEAVTQATVRNAAIGRAQLITATDVSQAGALSTESTVAITLDPYSFFPMIHVTNSGGGNGATRLTGHTTDGADPDAPRFNLHNDSTVNDQTYDVDYRYIGA